jgi:hypothetical protein
MSTYEHGELREQNVQRLGRWEMQPFSPMVSEIDIRPRSRSLPVPSNPLPIQVSLGHQSGTRKDFILFYFIF